MILFFDTETTGLYNFKAEPLSDNQPHLVQLACIGTDETGDEILQFNCLVRPTPDYTIPDDMIHGISHSEAMQYGISGLVVAQIFDDLLIKSDRLVCHNFGFDSHIMSTHQLRHSMNDYHLHQDKDYCTMMASTPYCKLPGKIPGKWKWPKLAEAFEYFFPGGGIDQSQLHDALYDVRMTKRIYFELMKREGVTRC